MSSSCPICCHSFSLPELEWHVNLHFLEEELARDRELAQQIAATPSPPRVTDNGANYEKYAGEASETRTLKSYDKGSNYRKRCDEEKISCLANLQIGSAFYRVEGGLMALLRKCLESESGKSVSIVSDHVDHFQSIYLEDSGWGCGWRNIQMLSSHLLMQRQEAGEVMFGGSRFVPDIPSLQRWLEIAWERGFDIPGSDSFNHKIYGQHKWIGTTECAALLRSFGLRARIVDFGSKEIELLSSSVGGEDPKEEATEGKRKSEQVYGPMDGFLLNKKCGIHQENVIKQEKFRNARNNHASTHLSKLNKFGRKKIDGHQSLIDWVWNYFTVEDFSKKENSQRVIISEKTPLYFQHDGHSRTIVGIQRQKGRYGMSSHYTLLVLDPAHRTWALEKSLKENFGWQKLIKRGVHTLKKPQYQLCYVDPGIAQGDEMEQLKTIDSIFFEL
ncbi:hypothetical protein AAC387_Pa06g0455 [Persea americana]